MSHTSIAKTFSLPILLNSYYENFQNPTVKRGEMGRFWWFLVLSAVKIRKYMEITNESLHWAPRVCNRIQVVHPTHPMPSKSCVILGKVRVSKTGWDGMILCIWTTFHSSFTFRIVLYFVTSFGFVTFRPCGHGKLIKHSISSYIRFSTREISKWVKIKPFFPKV